jgi:hypothetical protein
MNHHQRQFLQYLRGGGWVKVADVPDGPRVKPKLIELGWIIQRGVGPDAAFRITDLGLEELKAPIRMR